MSIESIIQAGGGPSRLGRQLGLNHASVIDWRKTGRVPVAHVIKIEQITGIPRHELRPDVYPPPASASPLASALPAPASSGEPAMNVSFGSLQWLTARRDQRPAVDVTSVALLRALHEEA